MRKLIVGLISLALAFPALAQSNYSNTAGIRAYDSASDSNKVKVTSGTITITPSGTQNVNVTQVGGNAVTTSLPVSDAGGSLTVDTLQLPSTLGVKANSASLSVAPSSDGVWPASQSGTWNVTNISGTVSLPTGASTAANQTTEINSLSSIDTKLTSQATAANQTSGNASLSSIDTKLTSQATAANQTTGNASLSSLDTKTVDSTIDANNSSAVALGISGVFTGTATTVTRYASVTVSVATDQASATNGLSIQQSSNGTNWDTTDTYTISAGVTRNISVPVFGSSFRVVYTNGGVAQGSFRLQTILHATQPWGSSVKPGDAMSMENDTSQVTNFNMLKNSTASTNGTADVQRSVEGSDGTGKGVAAIHQVPTSSANAALAYTGALSANGFVFKASAGNLYSLNVQAPASLIYVHVAGGITAVPADASTPAVGEWCTALASGASLDKVFTMPYRGASGVVVYTTSTSCEASVTKVAALKIAGQVQ